MLLAVRISSYGCTWEVWRALKKLELLSAAPRATLTHFSCSPSFPRASITRCMHAKHEQILKYRIGHKTRSPKFPTLKIYKIHWQKNDKQQRTSARRGGQKHI